MSTLCAAVGLGARAVFDPHVVLDDRLIPRTAELDVEGPCQQRFAASMFLTSAAVFRPVVLDA